MKKMKKLLPSEDRVIDVGWTEDGRLLLCFKYFEGPEPYDGYLPFSCLTPPLHTRDELDQDILRLFGTDYSLPDYD